jgi:hypothetical protein
MTVAIHQIPLEMMDGMMPHLAPHLARGLRFVKMNADQLADEIRRDLTQVWAVFVDKKLCAGFLTSLHDLPDRAERVLDIYGLGGSGAPHWGRELAEVMTAFAQANGCSKFAFAGKPGWARILGDDVKAVGKRDNGHVSYERAIA